MGDLGTRVGSAARGERGWVDRRHDRDAVCAALREGRLVTVTGAPGIGTTELAREVAATLRGEYPDGCWVIEFSAVTHPDHVADAVLAALGVVDARATAEERLVAHLADATALLVLDGADQVRSAVAGLAVAIVERCPRVDLLVTDHDPRGLQVPGERLVGLEPLAAQDGVRLLADRSPQGRPLADPDTLAALATRLGGIPLALELAAGGLRAGAAEELLAELPPDGPSMDALLDWLYEHLDGDAQAVWERSAILRGAVGQETLVEVVADEELPATRAAAAVDRLVSVSVLVRGESGGRRTLRLPDVLREYAAGRLAASGGVDAASDRHLSVWRRRIGTAKAASFGPEGPVWFHTLRAEHDEIRAALEWCAADPVRAEVGVWIVADLLHHWVMAGRFGEGRRWTERFPVEALSPRARAASDVVAGRLAVLQGELGPAREHLERGLEEATDAGDPTWRAHALHGLALLSVFWGDPAEALAPLEEALTLHRDGDDPYGAPLSLVQLATVHATLGAPEKALARAEECIALSREREERWCAAMARWTEALLEWRRGNVAEARAHAQEVLRLKRPFGDRMGLSMSVELVAWTDAVQGRVEQAAVLLGAVELAMRSVGGSLFHHLLEDHFRAVDRVRTALGSAYDSARERGQVMGFEEAVELALS